MEQSIIDSWQAKLAQDQANADAIRDRNAQSVEEVVRRHEALAAVSSIITATVGSVEQFGPYDQKLSGMIPLGGLGISDDQARSYGFGRAYVSVDTGQLLVETGRFFKRLSHERVATDNVNRFGVMLFAADKDGVNPTLFESVDWSIVNTTEENLRILAKMQDRLTILGSGVIDLATASRK